VEGVLSFYWFIDAANPIYVLGRAITSTLDIKQGGVDEAVVAVVIDNFAI
jgi:hypothetical protein